MSYDAKCKEKVRLACASAQFDHNILLLLSFRCIHGLRKKANEGCYHKNAGLPGLHAFFALHE